MFRQRGTFAIVMRMIAPKIPSIQDLGLPPAIADCATLKNGIVLVTGPTGSGKSSTLAAIIDLINTNRADHILTIEDPIEFLHQHKKGTVHQRELHTDTPTFALALRAALRQAPKVILVGEMRDRETIEIALTAAETGHLVFSTLHTIDASKTVERIVGTFEVSDQQAVRGRLAASFRYFISQRLIPKKGGGRLAIIEMLKATMRTREYIEMGEKEGKSLLDAMRDGALDGMQYFDGELEKLVRAGTISQSTAHALCDQRRQPEGRARRRAGRGLADYALVGPKGSGLELVEQRSAYSDRSASITSTRDARVAGISDAITAAAISTAAAPASGTTPGTSMLPKNPPANLSSARPAITPVTMPAPAITAPSPRMRVSRFDGVDPIASRTPNSRIRALTENASTPATPTTAMVSATSAKPPNTIVFRRFGASTSARTSSSVAARSTGCSAEMSRMIFVIGVTSV